MKTSNFNNINTAVIYELEYRNASTSTSVEDFVYSVGIEEGISGHYLINGKTLAVSVDNRTNIVITGVDLIDHDIQWLIEHWNEDLPFGLITSCEYYWVEKVYKQVKQKPEYIGRGGPRGL